MDFYSTFHPLSVVSRSDIAVLDASFDFKQLSRWVAKGYLDKLRSGVYRFSDLTVDEGVLSLMANILVKPSYVSLEFMLSQYGFIPESTYAITSVTSAKPRVHETSVGYFSYRHVKPSVMVGMRVSRVNGRPVKVACPEKAVLDYLYLSPHLNDMSSMEMMRFNSEVVTEVMDWTYFDQLMGVFGSKALLDRVALFKQVTGYA